MRTIVRDVRPRAYAALCGRVALWAVVCTMALPGVLVPTECRALEPAVAACSAFDEILYVYNSQQQLVDVTSTLSFYDGYDHVTVDGSSIPIVINHQEGHIYNLDGGRIGFTTSITQ